MEYSDELYSHWILHFILAYVVPTVPYAISILVNVIPDTRSLEISPVHVCADQYSYR